MKKRKRSVTAMRKITLLNELLSVDIPLPGESYRRSRYDWSGIITQVTLDGKHTFLSCENPDPAKAGGGLGLIGLFDSPNNLEYDSTEIVDRFPLMGVGLLKRPNMNAYSCFNEYDVLPFSREWDCDDSSAVFTTYPMLCNGYAMRQVKTISLQDNSVTITNRLTNEGEKVLNIREANHNFLQFDGHPIDDSYTLIFPYNYTPKVRRGHVSVGYNTLSLHKFDEATRSTAVLVLGYPGLSTHNLRIENSATKTGLTISEDFAASRVYVYFNEYAVAPEVFCTMSINPGETYTYNRRYRFYEI